MKFDPEDPRFTAYLLQELDAAECKEVEDLLASHPEAREFVDSLRETTKALHLEFLEAPQEAGIGDLRKARIAKAAKTTSPSKRWLLIALPIAAAALLLLTTVMGTSKDDTKTTALAYDESASQSTSAVRNKAKRKPQSHAAPAFKEGSMPSPVPTEPVTTALSKEESADKANKALPSGNAPATGWDTARGSYGTIGYGGGGAVTEGSGNGRKNSQPLAAEKSELSPRQRKALESLGYYGGEELDFPASPTAQENSFVAVQSDPLSTFSIDVDTASYSQMRSSLKYGAWPAPSQVRIEEFLNYFDYAYPAPLGDSPFGVVTEVSTAPWNPKHSLVRFGIKAKEIVGTRKQRANLVFLLDVSGSMSSPDKLPLLKKSFSLLLDSLDPEDRIAIVVYAGASGLVLPSTPVAKRKTILNALQKLKSGGGTNGGRGIELAYQVAQRNFMQTGINRVILATDGDFNIGRVSRPELLRLIETKARSGVFLTVLGFGLSSTGDSTMELLADKGNGNYAYIDTLNEAKKVLVDTLQGTLVTVAKDVKLQVEFNPKHVAKYRLIGYENRILANADFNDDKKDAGEIGAGHTVTALYEIIPTGGGAVDALKYQSTPVPRPAAHSDELLTLKLRYKAPSGSVSQNFDVPVANEITPFADASVDFKFASAVAAFGMILRHSEFVGSATLRLVLQWAKEGLGLDRSGYRREFLNLVRSARRR